MTALDLVRYAAVLAVAGVGSLLVYAFIVTAVKMAKADKDPSFAAALFFTVIFVLLTIAGVMAVWP